MLFFVNKSNPSLLKRLALVGGDEDKILLLVGDGVCFATEFWQEQFENLNVEEIYAETDAVQERNILWQKHSQLCLLQELLKTKMPALR